MNDWDDHIPCVISAHHNDFISTTNGLAAVAARDVMPGAIAGVVIAVSGEGRTAEAVFSSAVGGAARRGAVSWRDAQDKGTTDVQGVRNRMDEPFRI